jgi:hypothetical protein
MNALGISDDETALPSYIYTSESTEAVTVALRCTPAVPFASTVLLSIVTESEVDAYIKSLSAV